MFWVPVCILAGFTFGIFKTFSRAKKSIYSGRAKAYTDSRDNFRRLTKLTKEEKWEIDHRLSASPLLRRKILREFMGDNSLNWDEFGLFAHVHPAAIILAAQIGKLYIDPIFEFCTTSWNGRIPNQPSWVYSEMAERFLLRLEDELRCHGIDTTIAGEYSQNTFSPVRKYVGRNGYGNRYYPRRYNWIECTYSHTN